MYIHLDRQSFLAVLSLVMLLGCPQEMNLNEAPAFGTVVDANGIPIEDVKVYGNRSGKNHIDSLLVDFHEQKYTDELGSFSLGSCVRESYVVKNTGCTESERVLDEIIDFEIAFTHPGFDTLIIAFVLYNSDTTAYVQPYLTQVDSIIYIKDITWEKVDDAYELLPFTLKIKR